MYIEQKWSHDCEDLNGNVNLMVDIGLILFWLLDVVYRLLLTGNVYMWNDVMSMEIVPDCGMMMTSWDSSDTSLHCQALCFPPIQKPLINNWMIGISTAFCQKLPTCIRSSQRTVISCMMIMMMLLLWIRWTIMAHKMCWLYSVGKWVAAGGHFEWAILTGVWGLLSTPDQQSSWVLS